MSLILFWSATALIVYTYIAFPAIVFLRGRLRKQPYQTAEITPRVSLIIAAHNEERGIGAKLDNVLALDYPLEQLEVIIASDGSNDGTEAIVRRYADHGVRLLALPRQGKAPALNTAVAASTGEILVFSDANSIVCARGHPRAGAALRRRQGRRRGRQPGLFAKERRLGRDQRRRAQLLELRPQNEAVAEQLRQRHLGHRRDLRHPPLAVPGRAHRRDRRFCDIDQRDHAGLPAGVRARRDRL